MLTSDATLFFRHIVIPRPDQAGSTCVTSSGVGKVFVKYKQLPGAAAAVQSLADRTFAGKKVSGFPFIQGWAVAIAYLLFQGILY